MTARISLSNPFRKADTETTRFVILCQPRTGSSLLNTSLRQHPDIHMDREILNHRQRHAFPDEGAERIRACLARTTHRAVGCNLHAFQPDRGWQDWPKWESAWRALAEDRSIRVIHLWRLNTLAQLASWKIASFLNRWGTQEDITNRPRIHIDREEYRWFRDWNQAVFDWRLSHLTQHEVLPVTYESLRDDWKGTIQQVQQFLGVEPIPLAQAASRNETRPLQEVIANFLELQNLPWH